MTVAAPGAVPNNDPTTKAPSGATPVAWEYDAARNRHYDPNHGHFHEGPPPPPEARAATGTPAPGAAGATPSAPTPAPWTYDAKNNQHWDPNHGHWHQGPPPQVGSR